MGVHFGRLSPAEHVDSDENIQLPVRVVVPDEVIRSLQTLVVPGVIEKDAVAGREEAPILTVQFVLPAKQALLRDGVVPDYQTSGNPLVRLPCQVSYKIYQ